MSSARMRDPVLSLFRIVVALLFALHGASTLFGFPVAGQQVDVGSWPGWWAALIQFVGGGLVLVGLFTRAAAVLCSGSMAYAYFVVHQPQALWPSTNGGELSVLFCWSFLLVAVLGAGHWSVDAVLFRRGTADAPAGPAEDLQTLATNR